jgi:ABC-2 type transport system ATP-binding protein
MLKATNLSKNFRHPVLRDISFELDKGKSLVLMGKNGAGKTTMLKILASIILPDSGQIFADNVNILKDPSYFRLKSCFVFSDDRSFYMRLSGLDNIKFFSTFYNIDNKTFQSRLEKYAKLLAFPLSLLNQPVQEYSSGEIQLLSFIRAFIQDSNYIFIDEISRSLDEEHRKRIYSIVKDEESIGKAQVIITHSREEAGLLSKNIAVLEDGILNYV